MLTAFYFRHASLSLLVDAVAFSSAVVTFGNVKEIILCVSIKKKTGGRGDKLAIAFAF